MRNLLFIYHATSYLLDLPFRMGNVVLNGNQPNETLITNDFQILDTLAGTHNVSGRCVNIFPMSSDAL